MGKQPEEVSLIDIVDIIDGRDLFSKCLIRLDDCNDKEPCSMHSRYAEIRQNLLRLFENQKISNLVDEIKDKKSNL